MDLINDIQMLMEELTISIKKLRQTGNALAEAERDYKITLDFLALEAKRCEQYATVVKTLTRPCLVAYNER